MPAAPPLTFSSCVSPALPLAPSPLPSAPLPSPPGPAEAQQKIQDETATNMVNLRRTIYLTIMSALDFEEAGHKLLKMVGGCCWQRCWRWRCGSKQSLVRRVNLLRAGTARAWRQGWLRRCGQASGWAGPRLACVPISFPCRR